MNHEVQLTVTDHDVPWLYIPAAQYNKYESFFASPFAIGNHKESSKLLSIFLQRPYTKPINTNASDFFLTPQQP